MAFQVRQFEFEAGEQQFLWKFKLANINSSQLDFYSQDVATRSLLHLAQDFTAQIEQALQKRTKSGQESGRTVRKLCEKMLKNLKVDIGSFARDEQKEAVLAYFGKGELQASVRERIGEKSKRWVVATWVLFFEDSKDLNLFPTLQAFIQLSLAPNNFHSTTDAYLRSFIKDGKKLNPDFELLNQLYVVTVGDGFSEKEDDTVAGNANLVLVDINLNIEDKYISENFLWDSEDISNLRIKSFASHFLRDVLADHAIQLEKEALQDLEKETRIQIRTQILYKTLLRKYAFILLNFTAVDIPTEVKEYMIPIQIKLLADNGAIVFEDSFEWDILNEANNVEEFVDQLVEDYQLQRKYFAEICYKIRTQINSELEWKFDLLVKTFKSIHKDRESPKLNTQTISVLRRNIPYAMDVNLPCTDEKYKPNSAIYFNNSDLFSLLSRNMDILPEEFQEILLCKESKNQEKQGSKLTKQQSHEMLQKVNLTVENNPYIHGLGNTYNLHTIWRNSLAK